jgi:Flp pilus assembly CpaF family ATPase
MRRFIAKAINLIVIIARTKTGRQVKHLVQIEDFLDQKYITRK